MSTQTQINLQEKTTTELKALAYDLQLVTQNYTQMLQIVSKEIIDRQTAEAEAAQQAEAFKAAAEPKAETNPLSVAE